MHRAGIRPLPAHHELGRRRPNAAMTRLWDFILQIPTQTWAYAALGVVLVAAAVTDILAGKIYNKVTYPAAVAALVFHTVIGGLTGGHGSMGLSGALLGLAVGSFPLFIGWRMGGIGGGDAKLMGVVGAFAGWRFALAALFWGFAVAMVMALVVMLRRRITRRTMGRIWRFLLLTFTACKPGDPATPDSPKIAFGLALCIGSGIQLVDSLLGGPVYTRLFAG